MGELPSEHENQPAGPERHQEVSAVGTDAEARAAQTLAEMDRRDSAEQADAVRDQAGLAPESAAHGGYDPEAAISSVADGVRSFEFTGDVSADALALNALRTWPVPGADIPSGGSYQLLNFKREASHIRRVAEEWATPEHERMIREHWGPKEQWGPEPEAVERYWKEVAFAHAALLEQMVDRYPEESEAEDTSVWLLNAVREAKSPAARAITEEPDFPPDLRKALYEEAVGRPGRAGETLRADLLLPGTDFDPGDPANAGTIFSGEPVAGVHSKESGPLFWAASRGSSGAPGWPESGPFKVRDEPAARAAIRARLARSNEGR